jgi:hypothetical protein
VVPGVADWEARIDGTWADFWANLWPNWRRVLAGTDADEPPPAEPVLALRRVTTDYEWMGTFEPLRWLPAVTDALLWDENGMDLGPLTGVGYAAGRSWDRLQLAGNANVDLDQLHGTTVRHLILSNVDTDLTPLAGIAGLTSLTLDLRDCRGNDTALPPLPGLTELVLHPGTDVRHGPDVRVRRLDHLYRPPYDRNA